MPCLGGFFFNFNRGATPTAKFTSDTKTEHTDAFPTPNITSKGFTTNTKHQNQLFVLIGALAAA